MRNTTVLVGLITLGIAGNAHADFVHRPLVLPQGVWALDVGLGAAHLNRSPLPDVTGYGLNLELRGGLTDRLELGVRSGLRLGDNGRITQADTFGRTFDTETYFTGGDTFANPEIAVRYALSRTDFASVGLELRAYIPADGSSDPGGMVAVPVHFHLADVARVDTGLYVPFALTDPDTTYGLSIPLHVWFETGNVAVGLLTGVRAWRSPSRYTEVPLGVGLNLSVSPTSDLRAWIFIPNARDGHADDYYGGGVGIETRF